MPTVTSTSAKRADGAGGNSDLYLNAYNLLYANGSGFADDRGPEQQAQERCTKAMSDGRSTEPTIIAVMGFQHCFVTSDNRVAWMRVSTSTLTTFDSSAHVILSIRVW